MIDIATSVRLLLGLIVVVYGYVVSLRGAIGARTVVVSVVGIAPFLVWLIAPGALGIGEIEIPITARRAALIAGAASVALGYASIRAQSRSAQARTRLAAASGILVLAALTIGSANWLVATAAVVPVVATSLITPSEESSNGDPGRPGDPPES